MDTTDLKICVMKNVLQRIVEGKIDDLCEASVAAEVALDIVAALEKKEKEG